MLQAAPRTRGSCQCVAHLCMYICMHAMICYAAPCISVRHARMRTHACTAEQRTPHGRLLSCLVLSSLEGASRQRHLAFLNSPFPCNSIFISMLRPLPSALVRARTLSAHLSHPRGTQLRPERAGACAFARPQRHVSPRACVPRRRAAARIARSTSDGGAPYISPARIWGPGGGCWSHPGAPRMHARTHACAHAHACVAVHNCGTTAAPDPHARDV